jgi:cytochrome c5
MRRARWMAGLIACCLAVAAAQSQQDTAPEKQASKAQPAKSAASQSPSGAQNVGELKFQQNCNRCHNAPQELSPRISGTVALHMRVRASLSEADVKAILQYLAP